MTRRVFYPFLSYGGNTALDYMPDRILFSADCHIIIDYRTCEQQEGAPETGGIFQLPG